MSDLPSAWAETPLGDVCGIVSGSTPKSTEPAYWGGDIPWITPDDLSRHIGKRITVGRRSITEAGFASCSARMVPKGTILYTSRAPIGYVAIAAQPVCTNQGFKNIVPPAGISSDYLYWYMQYATAEVKARASGTTFAEISGKAMKAVPLWVAPSSEQERIVIAIEEQFSRLDAGVAALERVSRSIRRLRASVLDAAVTGQCVGENLGNPESEGLPGDWSWKPMSEIITRLRNGVFVSRPGTEPNDRPILRISALRPMALDVAEVRYIPASVEVDVDGDFVLGAGDLLFTRYSGNPEYVGACAMVPPSTSTLRYPDKLIRVQVDRSLVEPRFVEMAANSGLTRKVIRSKVKTTAGQTGISGGDLKGVPFPVPPLEAQRRTIEIVDNSLGQLELLDKYVMLAMGRTSSLRSAILAAAFSGKLVPQDDHDEPAVALLDRIASEGHRGKPGKAAKVRSKENV